ncbi:MAG: GlsB/YeaQ/YmgE family stress response membrane protein [Anaerolineae bacterium]|nr:GlsB/YeaQ/YmgE family stress response membrane protein [Anaerolineae bacterium]
MHNTKKEHVMPGLCGCLQCLWVIVIGGAAGYMAGYVIRGRGYNPIGNVLLGMAGFFVGGLFFGRLGNAGPCGAVIVSFLGALVLIFLVRVFLDDDFAG